MQRGLWNLLAYRALVNLIHGFARNVHFGQVLMLGFDPE
jgi:hypothetical protein